MSVPVRAIADRPVLRDTVQDNGMRYAIEFIRPRELIGVDPNDARWTRMIHKYVSKEMADLEVGWLLLEDDGLTYRVTPIGETEQ